MKYKVGDSVLYDIDIKAVVSKIDTTVSVACPYYIKTIQGYGCWVAESELKPREYSVVGPTPEDVADTINREAAKYKVRVPGENQKLVKHDSGKISLDCLHFEEIYKVLKFGAKKYGSDNWKNCSKEDQVRYQNAVERHFMEYKLGNKIDEESGLPALAHMACDILFLLHFQLQEKECGGK